jgi:hypothetical protein
MGKGQIMSGGTDGEYQVKLLLDRRRVNSEQFGLTRRIAAVAAEAAAMDAGTEKDKKLLQGTALTKRKDLIQSDMPTDPTVAAWCADLTEDLSGIVGTVEVPGERGTVLIQPGYDGNAAYDSDRDGVLQPSMGGTAESVYFNWALRPGWQKWMPTYRFGVITAISGDTCDLRLYNAQSSDQGLNLNQSTTLSSVAIEYMSCNGEAFSKGDHVLVKFEGQNWSNPKVIGFKDNPQPCSTTFYIRLTIDSKTLYYGGQKISVTYTKEDTSEATTAQKSIHGGGASPDSQKHYLAGPFELIDWDSGNVYINLQRARDTGAMSSVPSQDDDVTPIAGCGGGPYYTKRYRGINKMFDYFVEDLSSPEYRVFTYTGTWTVVAGLEAPYTRQVYDCELGYALEPDEDLTWTLHHQRIGLTSDAGAPDSDYSYDTLKYRRLTQIKKLILAAQVLSGASSETVYNWDLAEYETADVWELNIDFALKQAHYLWWHDNPNDTPNPYVTCYPYNCSGFGTNGWFPAASETWRYKFEIWDNDIETYDTPTDGDGTISHPYMTFNLNGYIDGFNLVGSAGDKSCFLYWSGGWVFDQYPGADEGCFQESIYRLGIGYEDWTPLVNLSTGTPPILVVASEENHTPTQALSFNGNLERTGRKERHNYLLPAPDCSPSADPECVDVDDEEIPQLCEMVSALDYWY